MSIASIVKNSAVIVVSTTASAVIGKAWNDGSQSWLDSNVAIKQKGVFGGVKYTTTTGKKLSKKSAQQMMYQMSSNELIKTRVGVGAAIGSISTLGAVGLSVGGIKATDAIAGCARNGMTTIQEKLAAKKLAATEQPVEQVEEVEVISEEEVTEE